jgi:AcrR family transcriptional regulator
MEREEQGAAIREERDEASAGDGAARRRRAGLDDRVILRAAEEIADREGLERLSLARLAERLGVRPPSLYNHVAGLDDVRRGLALEGARALAGRLARAAVGKPGAEGVRAIGEAYRAFAREHPGLYAALQRAPAPDNTALIAASEDIMAILRAALAPWGLDEAEQVHAIRTLRSLAHGFVSLEVAGGFGMPYDLRESYEYALALFIAGLGARRSRK